jgi:hypothetical protein
MHPDSPGSSPGLTALASLRRLMRPQPVRERCDLCSAELADEHAHLVELASRRLVCACDPCAILFSAGGAGKYRRVPRDARLLANFSMTDVQWADLNLPINLAFFLHSTSAGRVVALYPSPGGAAESLPAAEAWQALVEANPVLRDFEPNVEALLANRLGAAPEYYSVGVDRCYELVGLIRTHWKGLSGGTEVWAEIEKFFRTLRQRCGVTGDAGHA